MFTLENKTIIITGGIGLLGQAFSMACAEHGANVIIADVDEEHAKELINSMRAKTGNDSIIFRKCNIINLKDIQNLTNFTIDKFEKIDALVNNAYPRNKNYGKRYIDISYEDFCENINLHLGGYFLTIKEISKVMIDQNFGNIINIASIYGFAAPRFEIYEGTNMTMPVEYAAIKGALINLTRYFASCLGNYNIRVNVISPGGILNRQPECFIKNYSRNVILGKRMANTNDMIGALIFLLSDGSRYITGHNLIVDGGWTL